ncbi:MAG: hypothetical protein ACM359_03075 [Bacillota bacterium]
MMKWKGELTGRQWALCMAAAMVILAIAILRYGLVPSAREWKLLRSQWRVKNAEYARLVRNVGMKQGVEEQFTRLGAQAYQNESDPMTLAAWLRELELLARLPSMTLNNMKAMPVKHESAYKLYRVRLAVSGKLPEVMKFISAATHGESLTGLESFALRGVPGVNMVECGLSLRMIRLLPEAKKEGEHGQ